jgi:hypothetical protein
MNKKKKTGKNYDETHMTMMLHIQQAVLVRQSCWWRGRWWWCWCQKNTSQSGNSWRDNLSNIVFMYIVHNEKWFKCRSPLVNWDIYMKRVRENERDGNYKMFYFSQYAVLAVMWFIKEIVPFKLLNCFQNWWTNTFIEYGAWRRERERLEIYG